MIDLTHGVVHIHEAIDRNTGDAGKTNTRNTRRVPIRPNVAPLLRALIDEVGEGERLFGWPLRIMLRAGHDHFSTTEPYIREAENPLGVVRRILSKLRADS